MTCPNKYKLIIDIVFKLCYFVIIFLKELM